MYLGIDLGTSGIKALLLDDAQRVLAEADAPLSVSYPQPLWSEQQPQDWWQATESVIAQLRGHAPAAFAAIRAIGLSGQMHGAVLLDEKHAVLRPAILWNDGRAFEECKTLDSAEPQSRHITGNLAMPGFTAPKLLWLRRHEPQVFEQTQLVLLPKDWLRLRLTGEAVSDMSDASGTLWLDVAARAWSERMLHACGMRLPQMPRLVEGCAASGVLRSDIAKVWGVSPQTLVAGGGGDNAASAVGIGAVRDGQGFVSLGTSGVVFLVTAAFAAAPESAVHAFAHALPARWHQMSVMLSAASALSWATRLTHQPSEAALLVQAAQLTRAQRERAPLFLPYLAGERTPHNDPHASGTLIGLRHEHGAADVAYAVMEGVSFGLMQGLQAMAPDHAIAELSLVGGGARSDVWAQLLASGLRCTMKRPRGTVAAAALGAARLAMLCTGADEAATCTTAHEHDAFSPDAEQIALLMPRYQRYCELYPALKGRF